MTNRKQISRTRKKIGSNPFFNTTNSIIGSDPSPDGKAYKAVTTYYDMIGTYDLDARPLFGDCFAVRIAAFIIDAVENETVTMTARGLLPASFFTRCRELLEGSDLAREVGDEDCLIIYLKQTAAMLRAAGIVARDGGNAVVKYRPESGEVLFECLFKAFWQDVPWERIFPSDTAAAGELQKNRNILKDILLRHHSRVRLDLVANEFFDLTGFCTPNDLFMISFLDFYYFTWLRHFGCIRYLRQSLEAPVCIQVTEAGRKFLPAMA